MTSVNFSELIGQTFTTVKKCEVNINSEAIEFSNNTVAYNMYHQEDCCECVWIDDICGDLSDLTNSPIIVADEVVSTQDDPLTDLLAICPHEESYTWTFYRLSTIKGSVVIRWYGSSNGYYSESVSLYKM